NLDKLGALEATYKPNQADDSELQEKKARLQLAEVQRELPLARAELYDIERGLRLIAGRKLLDSAAELLEKIELGKQKQAELRLEREALDARLASIEQLKEVRDLTRTVGEGLHAVEIENSDILRLNGEIEAAEQQAASLPELKAQIDQLKTVATNLETVR